MTCAGRCQSLAESVIIVEARAVGKDPFDGLIQEEDDVDTLFRNRAGAGNVLNRDLVGRPEWFDRISSPRKGQEFEIGRIPGQRLGD